jgi:hypothetical protein
LAPQGPSSKLVARGCRGVISLRVTFRPHPRCRWCRSIVWSRLHASVRLGRWHSVLVWTRLTGAVDYVGDALFSSGNCLWGFPRVTSLPLSSLCIVCWCVFFNFRLPSVPHVKSGSLEPILYRLQSLEATEYKFRWRVSPSPDENSKNYLFQNSQDIVK